MKPLEQLTIKDFSAGALENFRILPDGSLRKRDGSTLIHTFDEKIRGAISVREDDGDVIYAVTGWTLWRIADDVRSLGYLYQASFADENDTVELFMFAGKLYILGGGEYFCWNGKYVDVVEGYIPLIRRKAGPTNTGIEYERINMLTSLVRMRFKPDGVTTQFRLWGSVDYVDYVKVNDEEVDYTLSYSSPNYSITLDEIVPESSDDCIEVQYSLWKTSRRSEIISCRHAAVYGGDTDSRVFVYGGKVPSDIYPSDPQDAYTRQTISAEYFPSGAEITVGDGNLYVTGAVRQFDRLAIFTEDGAFYTYPREESPVSGIPRYSFPILPLNSDVGATKEGGAVLVENEPFALNENGLFRFKSTSVRDERLAVLVEAPDYIGLTRDFIETCTLYVNRLRGELWCVGHDGHDYIIVYNARLDAWYRFSGITPDMMFTHASYAAFTYGSSLYRFTPDAADDSGTPFSASYDSGALPLGDAFDCKTLYEFGVSMERVPGAKLDCELTNDRGEALSLVFTVPDSDSDSPSVIRSHARLGHSSYVSFRLTSPADSSAADVREVSLRYRAV